MLVVALAVSQIVLRQQLERVRAELQAARQAYEDVTAGKTMPPGGVPLRAWEPGAKITTEFIANATQRLNAAPPAELDKWVAELERITDSKFNSDVQRQGCRTDFVNQMSVAFNGLQWNAKVAEKLFRRAQSIPTSEALVWTDTLEALLKKKFQYTHVVPLVLIPVDALYVDEKYSTEQGDKYLARLKRLTAADVARWKDEVDEFGGTEVDAAMNIVLSEAYFKEETFQRDKFLTGSEATEESSASK